MDELEPVFSALAGVQAACADKRERAERRAGAVRAHARDQAADIVASARVEADAERARAAAHVRDRDEQAVAERMREAAAAAEEVRRRSAARMPEMVARVAGLVRSLADEPS
ncbi:hypothetical protein ACI2LC_09235 [Nonomuraea wenchangensis]|uniref:hypothetical protein n=1 Tax=Nonomuraea wenchangensis TaxID=568860 RepID=UPI00384ED9C8